MRTRLLIDGDVIAFSCASASQTICYDHDLVFPVAHKRLAEGLVDNVLSGFRHGFKAEVVEVYLSDPLHNWRFDVDPFYKGNRSGKDKPLLLGHLKGYLRERHGAEHWKNLEADDVLSLLATEPSAYHWPGGLSSVDVPAYDRTIIIGTDKDFKSIPGLHHTWKKDQDFDANLLTREVTQWEADKWHMLQTLAGDRVDGYFGCPGVGMKRAEEIIASPVKLVPQKGVKTRGFNKGEEVTKWVGEPTSSFWTCITSHYLKGGMSEADALKASRMARLLRHGEYDRETGAVTLWTPDKLPAIPRRSHGPS